MGWKDARIKELETQIKRSEEWIEERHEFGKKLDEWLEADKKELEALRASK